MIIEVCGPGCPRCHATKENVRKALKEMELEEGKEVALTEIKDPNTMAARGVFMTPAVLIDGVKLCEGKIPSPQEIKGWIEERR
ncbi:MAG: thioredoxin family protein [Dehalococcoidales bacterium]|nr:thioredoxin family protein [Dehalococcoidales bacterium]